MGDPLEPSLAATATPAAIAPGLPTSQGDGYERVGQRLAQEHEGGNITTPDYFSNK